MKHRSLLILISLLLPASGRASWAQEPEIDYHRPGDPPPAPPSGQDTQERMRQLFASVERRLESIDLMLGDAAAGDTSSLTEVADAGLDRLLRDSVDSGREVQRELDELLQIAQQMSQSSSSSGSQSGQPQSPGESPGASSGQGQDSQSQEQTPSMPESSGSQGGEEPQPGEGEEPSGEGEQPGGTEPEGQHQPEENGASGEEGENSAGEDPLAGETERLRARDLHGESWGNLPSHVRDTFQAEGRGELPSRYRDWIDGYYHRLNRRASGPR